MEPTALLQQVRAAGPGPQRTSDLEALDRLVRNKELRDFPFGEDLYRGLFALLSAALSWRAEESQSDVRTAERVFLGAAGLPEFEVGAAEPFVEDQLMRALHSRADGSSPQDEWPLLRDLYLWFYGHFPRRRSQLRSLIGRTLRSAAHFTHRSAPVGPLLEVLEQVIRGFKAPLESVHKALLFELLLPLHRSNDWQQWDRQTPIIAMFHKELVRCILVFLQKQPQLAPRCVEVVCSYFPTSRESNTPKEVLLVYEISQLLRLMDQRMFQQVSSLVLQQMVRLLGSHNSQPIQSVLQYWKDDRIASLFAAMSTEFIPVLLPALLRGGEPFWNPTVNRMTTLVLEKLEASNPEAFFHAAEDLWGPGKQVPAFVIARAEARAAEKRASAAREEGGGSTAAPKPPGAPKAPTGGVASLKYCLGGWKPPGASGGGSGGKPPLTATGVAPWAQAGPAAGGAGSAGGKQPPLTATGVAPWAFAPQGARRAGPLSAGRLGPQAPGGGGGGEPGQDARPSISSLGAFAEEDEEEAEPAEVSGVDRVREYAKVLCPDAAPCAAAGAPWEAALAAEAPTLLPSLKFHQLVFGAEDLAAGAFSVVRYARTIVKETTQAHWPEYAVKVINTQTIQEHGYEASVNREICVLRMLSHPGIARMVSSFRYRDGAYLVLEYAAKGDLHTILVQQGSLPEASVRFFIGEVIAALCAIHDAGFVYSDLKPENVVITATCHAKLTDFGACRPFTDEARRRTQASLLGRLRDGSWRAKDTQDEQCADPVANEAEAAAAADDRRVEGTTLYLPPEVVRGGLPTIAADAWALGCLLCQLLLGKPPTWADSGLEEDVRSRIVSFKVDSQAELAALSEGARGLAAGLLRADAPQRLSVEGAASDVFFEGEDVFRFYARPRGPEVAAGERRTTGGDERWQKRQFSKIWTVMPSPQDYAMPAPGAPVRVGGLTAAPADFTETEVERGTPFADEFQADVPFGAARSSIRSL